MCTFIILGKTGDFPLRLDIQSFFTSSQRRQRRSKCPMCSEEAEATLRKDLEIFPLASEMIV